MKNRTDSMHDAFQGLLDWKRWSLPVFLFLMGYVLYVSTDKLTGFVYEMIHHAGLFLSAVVAVHFIHEIFVRREEGMALRAEIADVIAETVDRIFPAHYTWGLRGFVHTPNLPDLFDRLEAGDELLWLDTYAPSLHLTMEKLNGAMDRGASVRMLALLPDSTVARFRGREIKQPGFSEERFLADLKLFVGEVSCQASAHRDTGSLNVRLYEDLPCIPMYVHIRGGVPVRGLTSFFLARASESFAHIEWTIAEQGMLPHFVEYFENKWASAHLPAAPTDAPEGEGDA